MTSLRKRVSSYFRQLSFHNEPRERKANINENSFVMKYLTGQIKFKEGPPVLYGKSPNDLPNYELDIYTTGVSNIVGCSTGPNGGLTTVKREEKHLDITDPDIDFIDTQEENVAAETKSKSPKPSKKPLDNSTMVIKVAGQEYRVTNTKRKSRSLGSLTDLTLENSASSDLKNVPNNNNVTSDSQKCDENNVNGVTEKVVQITHNKISHKSEVSDDSKLKNSNSENVNRNFSLSKSKSECNPFEHRKKGKIIRLTERPKAQEETDNTNNANISGDVDDKLPKQWSKKTEYVYGISDSLYDLNQVTKCKNGNPIADCYGVIARTDSCILALADGVNWGEKACLAAKSAVHGCLHYLNKTIFDDVSIFEYDPPKKSDSSPKRQAKHQEKKPTQTKPKRNIEKLTEFSLENNENRISNTMEVFICLLRAFNCAHNLILENQGMLTTLTVAVVLPLKPSNLKKPKDTSIGSDNNLNRSPRPHSADSSGVSDGKVGERTGPHCEKYVCCVCNVGDTLAYVYSQKYGVRELTKGSHDVYLNRDMRDALGALGPVDGINPELNNLTLSVTTLDAGDIVMIASDGLTDNYDPTVCKFTVNTAVTEPPKPHRSSHSSHSNKDSKRLSHANASRETPSRERKHSTSSRNKETSRPPANTRVSSHQTPNVSTRPAKQGMSRINKENKKTNDNIDVDVTDNPLVAQFMQDNSLERAAKSKIDTKPSQRQTDVILSKRNENKMLPLMKSSSVGVFKSKNVTLDTNLDPPTSKYNFLRSKTTLELKPAKIIPRNEEGLPYVSPIQKYEITLLLIEDILKQGISGKEEQCTTAKLLCENLLRYTISITAAKRHTLEDVDLYFDNKNDIMVEVSQKEKKLRRKRCLEKVQNLPGKLDHVSVVACNVGNRVIVQKP